MGNIHREGFMKLIMIMLAMSMCFLSGCGKWNRIVAIWTDYSEICVDGVTYLQFTSGASVKYTDAGTIQKCQK